VPVGLGRLNPISAAAKKPTLNRLYPIWEQNPKAGYVATKSILNRENLEISTCGGRNSK